MKLNVEFKELTSAFNLDFKERKTKFECELDPTTAFAASLLEKVKADNDETEANIAEMLESAGSGGSYELIETIEVTEPITIKRSEEPDGTPYNFKAMFIQLECKATDIAVTRWFFRNATSNRVVDVIMHDISAFSNNTVTQRCFFEARIANGWWALNAGNWSRYQGNVNLQVPMSDGNRLTTSAKDTPTITYLFHSGTLPAGTTVKIWGVRA